MCRRTIRGASCCCQRAACRGQSTFSISRYTAWLPRVCDEIGTLRRIRAICKFTLRTWCTQRARMAGMCGCVRFYRSLKCLHAFQAIPKDRFSTFENRQPLPASWRGLRDEALCEQVGSRGENTITVCSDWHRRLRLRARHRLSRRQQDDGEGGKSREKGANRCFTAGSDCDGARCTATRQPGQITAIYCFAVVDKVLSVSFCYFFERIVSCSPLCMIFTVQCSL